MAQFTNGQPLAGPNGQTEYYWNGKTYPTLAAAQAANQPAASPAAAPPSAPPANPWASALPSTYLNPNGSISTPYANWLRANEGKQVDINGQITKVPTKTPVANPAWADQLAKDVQAGNYVSNAAAPGTFVGMNNVPGVGNVPIWDNSSGATYYTQGGKNYGLTPQQMIAANIPQVIGYTQGGTPIYQTAQQSQANANAPTPEANALQDLYKTDPGLKALINAGETLNTDAANNAIAAEKANAPANLSTQTNLANYYNNLAKSTVNGTLDPATLNEVQQASRAAQVARGNPYGTAQAAQEALTTGITGYEMGQQNAQNIMSYLGNNQNLGTNAASNLSSYLNSGTTPAAMGSRNLSDIINQANSANTGSNFQSTYNPASTFTYLNPSAGTQFSTGANNWYNSANYQYLGSGAANPGMGTGASAALGAGEGALSGAGTGAAIGSIIPGLGTLVGGAIGAGVGALGGGLSGAACWVAREVYGADNPKWMIIRHWMLNDAPERLRKAYLSVGESFARFISDKPELKNVIKIFMDKVLEVA